MQEVCRLTAPDLYLSPLENIYALCHQDAKRHENTSHAIKSNFFGIPKLTCKREAHHCNPPATTV